jgi:hypothetical protein
MCPSSELLADEPRADSRKQARSKVYRASLFFPSVALLIPHAALILLRRYALGVMPFPKRYVTWFEHSRPVTIIAAHLAFVRKRECTTRRYARGEQRLLHRLPLSQFRLACPPPASIGLSSRFLTCGGQVDARFSLCHLGKDAALERPAAGKYPEAWLFTVPGSKLA